MSVRFVNIDHDTPMLLPPDLRDWVAPDHMVHFIMDAVVALDLRLARVNQRGTGSAQYPPSMMLGLLIYCYATGTFASRRIETLTYENVAVRYLCADTHPDHDSICKFRRENKDLLSTAFHQVLELAARARVLQVGNLTVVIDGTKILANASKHSAVSHGHAVEQMQLASEQITELLAKAESAESTPLQDGLTIPEEIKRREDRIAKLGEAVKVMEARAKERLLEEQAEYEAKLAARKAKEESTGRKPRGKVPEPPKEGARPKDQYNFTAAGWRVGGRAHGMAVGYRGGQEALRLAQADGRTGLRHHQGSHRVPAVPAARTGESQPGVDPGDHQLQPQAALQSGHAPDHPLRRGHGGAESCRQAAPRHPTAPGKGCNRKNQETANCEPQAHENSWRPPKSVRLVKSNGCLTSCAGTLPGTTTC